MFWIFLFLLIFRLKSSNASCSGIMKTIFVYDEYVCDEKFVCDEFLKQVDFAKAFHEADNMTDSFNPFAVLSSGYHPRQVVKFYTTSQFNEKIHDGIKDYFWSPQNLTNTLGLILPLVFRNGYHSPKPRSVIFIFTSTNEKKYNWESIKSMLETVSDANGQVYAVGVGTNIQEEVLKSLSSEPKKRNENYFLEFNSSILLQVLRKERIESLYCPLLFSKEDEKFEAVKRSTESSTIFSSDDSEFEITTKERMLMATTNNSWKNSTIISSDNSSFEITTLERMLMVTSNNSWKNTTIFNSDNSSFEITTIERMLMATTNDSWKNLIAGRNKLEPNLQTSVWVKIKRLSRIYGKYFMIGSLMGSIGAMAPYWTFCQNEAPRKLTK